MSPLARRPARPAVSRGAISAWLALAAAASWMVALWQALPRLTAGPICSSSQDAWAFAGHCPACFVGAAFTLAFLASLIRPRTPAVVAHG